MEPKNETWHEEQATETNEKCRGHGSMNAPCHAEMSKTAEEMVKKDVSSRVWFSLVMGSRGCQYDGCECPAYWACAFGERVLYLCDGCAALETDYEPL